MAALDSDFEESLRGRDKRRRLLIRTVLARITQKYGKPTNEVFEQTVDALYALTSFAMFDTMAEDDGKADDIAHFVQRLARLALGIGERPSGDD